MRRDQPVIRLKGPPLGTAGRPFGSEGRRPRCCRSAGPPPSSESRCPERPAHHSAQNALGKH